jgi:SAM-dependent methyltransferase
VRRSVIKSKDHLGGFIPGGDAATWFPELWQWATEYYGVKSVLDIGCGEGLSTQFFDDLGCRAVGLDGVKQANPLVRQHDFALGPWKSRERFDLVWSCEFLEHIEERFVPNLMSAFRTGKIVMLTHAFPGQGGHHHVNCRTPDYWKGVFAAAGFEFLPDVTNTAHFVAAVNKSPWNHFLRSGMVFKRVD